MTLTVPRATLAAAAGFLVALTCLVAALALPRLIPARPPAPPQSVPGKLTPLVAFSQAGAAFDWRRALDRFGPLLPVPLGLAVFFGLRRVLRVRIVLDRQADSLSVGARRICALSELLRVEFDDAPRVYVMNTLDIVVPPPRRRIMLLTYDRSTDAALYEKARQIAAFAGVPLTASMGVRARRR